MVFFYVEESYLFGYLIANDELLQDELKRLKKRKLEEQNLL